MTIIRVLNASYRKASSDPLQLIDQSVFCIALAGRSNVGKSSIINRIANAKKLARTSNTPGCTRDFHLYELNLEIDKHQRKKIHLLDMPGFGYAKVSQADRRLLRKKIADFLDNAQGLGCLCILNDVRRAPEDDELALRDMAFEAGIPVLIVLTKADKLKKNDLKKQSVTIANAYGLESQDLAVTGTGITIDKFLIACLAFLQERAFDQHD